LLHPKQLQTSNAQIFAEVAEIDVFEKARLPVWQARKSRWAW